MKSHDTNLATFMTQSTGFPFHTSTREIRHAKNKNKNKNKNVYVHRGKRDVYSLMFESKFGLHSVHDHNAQNISGNWSYG